MAVLKQAAALAALQSASKEMLNEHYTVSSGPQVLFELPRKVLLRNFIYSLL